MQNLSYENEFDLHEHECAGRTCFHMIGFTGRLVSTQRHIVTWKWPLNELFIKHGGKSASDKVVLMLVS